MVDQQRKTPSFVFMVLTAVAATVVSAIAENHIKNDASLGIGICTVPLLVVAWIYWDLKRKWWFWLALCMGAALQVPLVVLVPWATPHFAGTGETAFVIPGFAMALGCVFLAEKVAKLYSRN